MTKDYKYSIDLKLQTFFDQLDVAVENKDDDLIKTIISDIKDINYSVDTIKLQTLLDQLDVAVENKEDASIELIKQNIKAEYSDPFFYNDNELIKYLIDYENKKGLNCSIDTFYILTEDLSFDINYFCPLIFAIDNLYNSEVIKAIVNSNFYNEISIKVIANVINNAHILGSASNANVWFLSDSLNIIDFLLYRDVFNSGTSCVNDTKWNKENITLLTAVYENIENCEDKFLKGFYEALAKILVEHGAKTNTEKATIDNLTVVQKE